MAQQSICTDSLAKFGYVVFNVCEQT